MEGTQLTARVMPATVNAILAGIDRFFRRTGRNVSEGAAAPRSGASGFKRELDREEPWSWY